MYIDDVIVGAICLSLGFIAGIYNPFKKKEEFIPGVEPTYIVGRGDRSPHVHSYDTMDIATNGKWVCGICRKAKP